MQTDDEQRPFASGSGARPSGLRQRIEAAAALYDDEPVARPDERPDAADERDEPRL